MLKKLVLGLLVIIFIALLVGWGEPGAISTYTPWALLSKLINPEITTVEGEYGIYKSFLGNIFARLLEPNGDVYAGWVKGLKKDKSFIVKRISTEVEILQVEENGGDALVGFKLILKAYCLAPSGNKVTYISSKMAISIMKANPTKPDDLKKFKAGPETTNIVDGWNGQLDV